MQINFKELLHNILKPPCKPDADLLLRECHASDFFCPTPIDAMACSLRQERGDTGCKTCTYGLYDSEHNVWYCDIERIIDDNAVESAFTGEAPSITKQELTRAYNGLIYCVDNEYGDGCAGCPYYGRKNCVNLLLRCCLNVINKILARYPASHSGGK